MKVPSSAKASVRNIKIDPFWFNLRIMLLLPVLIAYICEDASLIESVVDVVSYESFYVRAIIVIDFDGMERLKWSYVLNSRNCHRSTDVAKLTRLIKTSANNSACNRV